MQDDSPAQPAAAPEEARAPTITIPLRHAVRTVIDGASITVVPDGAPDPQASPSDAAARQRDGLAVVAEGPAKAIPDNPPIADEE